ncbi:hypothetical protein RDI58_017330 [Solanum bulbocastanum]|uniref:Uncharacterized protein n=1 Tax=Solanum bulbocastanum TaxID=147425 RepID=A0AAN8THJ5_SOLBU
MCHLDIIWYIVLKCFACCP